MVFPYNEIAFAMRKIRTVFIRAPWGMGGIRTESTWSAYSQGKSLGPFYQ